MVSIASYTISEFVFQMIITYVLIILAMIAKFIEDVVEEKNLLFSLVVFIGIIGLVIFIYSLPIRIGIVNFINGMVFMYFVLTVYHSVKLWREQVNGES